MTGRPAGYVDDREWSWLAWKASTKLARRSRPSLSWIRRPGAPHRIKARQQAAGGHVARPSQAAAPRVLPGLKVGACTRQPRRGRRARRNKSPERGRAAAYTVRRPRGGGQKASDRRAWQTAEPGVRCAGVSEQPGGCEKRTRILSQARRVYYFFFVWCVDGRSMDVRFCKKPLHSCDYGSLIVKITELILEYIYMVDITRCK